MKRWAFALLAPFALVACGGSADGPARDSGDNARGDTPATVTSATVPAPAAPNRDDGPAVSPIETGVVPSNATPSGPAPQPQPTSPPPAFSIPAPPTSTPAPTPSPPPSNEPPRPDVPAPAVVVPVPGGCPFEYLGEWIRCEHAGSPNVVQLDAANSIEDCMRECLNREDCTAVTDYFWLDRPDLGCWLYTSTCDAPASQVWGEEDGGREYRKACAAD